ncbi:MAG: tryptophan--tRNA ligase [Candidatus Marsarchaeota archaeon]|nr:tryptophan--tRNA ligase [Candidatus Marsarchaeota archaeon]
MASQESVAAGTEGIASVTADNIRLIEKFGAGRISDLDEIPDFYTFKNGLIYSHRDFDRYMSSLKGKKKCAIVSGFNASGLPHLGHIPVFDTNLFFQREYGVNIFMPISDDESYVSGKVKTQEEAIKNSFMLVRTMIAYGFDPSKTKFIIDHIYTNIYNLAIRLSRGLTLSEVKAVYGYTADQNIGLQFYPVVQSAHITYPLTIGYDDVMVPIGSDEDSHMRVCRDLAGKFGMVKPAALHSIFMPGLDGEKMSKSRNNGIFLNESEKEVKRKIMSAFSGGQVSVEEHRKHGGNPDVDMAYFYLKSYFLDKKEAEGLAEEYRKGRVLSGEMKNMLFEKVMDRISRLKAAYLKVSEKDMEKGIMLDEGIDLRSMMEKYNVFE